MSDFDLFLVGVLMSAVGVIKDEWLGRPSRVGTHLVAGAGFLGAAAVSHCPLLLMFPVFYFFQLLDRRA